jgi:hypothetical protein
MYALWRAGRHVCTIVNNLLFNLCVRLASRPSMRGLLLHRPPCYITIE